MHLFTEVKKSVLYEAPSNSNKLKRVLTTISNTTGAKYFFSLTIPQRPLLFKYQYNKIGRDILTENKGKRGTKKMSNRIRLKHIESNLSSLTVGENRVLRILQSII